MRHSRDIKKRLGERSFVQNGTDSVQRISKDKIGKIVEYYLNRRGEDAGWSDRSVRRREGRQGKSGGAGTVFFVQMCKKRGIFRLLKKINYFVKLIVLKVRKQY